MLDKCSFDGTDMRSLPYEDIRHAASTYGLSRVRGLFDREELRLVLAAIVSRFDADRDQRHDPRDTDAPRRNFQKLQVGANSGVGSRRTLGRFMRVLYNPIFADDVYGMRPHFMT